MRRAIVPIFSTIIILCAFSVEGGSSDQPSIAPSEVYIWNGTKQELRFQITGNTCEPPLDTTLRSDYSSTYSCENASFFNITIATSFPDGRVVTKEYSLKPTRRYRFFENAEGVFDVAELQPR